MNIIIDQLPETVEVNGLKYPINTDFRVSMLFEIMLTDAELTDYDKMQQAIKLYYPIAPLDLGGAIEQILWFYAGGKEQQAQETAGTGKTAPAVYSFDCDDSYIYAAFMSQYGMDLQDAQLHWWKFKALFQGLSDDSKFCKIMGYRSLDISGDMSQKQKEFYRKMKKLYALPQPHLRLGQKQTNALEEALLNGGDVSEVMQKIIGLA